MRCKHGFDHHNESRSGSPQILNLGINFSTPYTKPTLSNGLLVINVKYSYARIKKINKRSRRVIRESVAQRAMARVARDTREDAVAENHACIFFCDYIRFQSRVTAPVFERKAAYLAFGTI